MLDWLAILASHSTSALLFFFNDLYSDQVFISVGDTFSSRFTHTSSV